MRAGYYPGGGDLSSLVMTGWSNTTEYSMQVDGKTCSLGILVGRLLVPG